ncbi:hypothetical protein JCM33374_g3042 [Metschnikowia sp. JCM 33374]|nr:hypothetical protein JCM33374_g3042 [Metschnikowia sp. JCM 33374]
MSNTTNSTTNPNKSIRLTLEQRTVLRKYSRRHPEKGNASIQQWFIAKFGFYISQSSVYYSLSSNYEHLDNPTPAAKKKRKLQLEAEATKKRKVEVEHALCEWYRAEKADAVVSDSEFREKTLELWDQKFSGYTRPAFRYSWLGHFRSKNGLREKILQEKILKGNENVIYTNLLQEVKTIMQKYEPSHIYNCDQTDFFWNHSTHRKYEALYHPGLGKKNKRFTLHLCCNGDASDRLIPWFVGEEEKPSCFDEVTTPFTDCVWRSTENACINVAIMKEWLISFNGHAASTDKHVLLVMDDYSVHKEAVKELTEVSPLSNTKICFLPPKASMKVQPLNLGIIKYVKSKFRSRYYDFAYRDRVTEGHPLLRLTELHGVTWTVKIWNDLASETITDSWREADFPTVPELPTPEKTPDGPSQEDTPAKSCQGITPDSVPQENEQDNIPQEIVPANDPHEAAPDNVSKENAPATVPQEVTPDNALNESIPTNDRKKGLPVNFRRKSLHVNAPKASLPTSPPQERPALMHVEVEPQTASQGQMQLIEIIENSVPPEEDEVICITDGRGSEITSMPQESAKDQVIWITDEPEEAQGISGSQKNPEKANVGESQPQPPAEPEESDIEDLDERVRKYLTKRY